MLLEQQYNKSKDELLDSAIEKLQDKTEITNFNPGGLARTFLEIYSDELQESYTVLTNSMLMGFVSQSRGIFLDELGKLVDCHRRDGEDDDNFRYRITKQNQSLATANETAIRLACLSIEGINDVEFKDFLRGVGTFEVYLITDNPEPSSQVVQSAEEAIASCQAKGVDGKVLIPEIIKLDIEINVFFYEGVPLEDKRRTKLNIQKRIEEYINNQRMGGNIIIAQLSKEILSADNSKENNIIKNAQIKNLHLNGEMVYVRDMSFRWDERPAVRNLIIN